MKANEIPKKIYLQPLENNEIYNHWYTLKLNNDFIEYTRTDVFIKKACEWLKENFLFDEAGYCRTNIYSTESMIYNFKNTLGCKL